jgi:hypothetical protein
MFDWPRFLADHGIEYFTDGANIARDNIGIACPFCGDDPSHHMGISLLGKGWSCWRKAGHRGKHPARLIAALLGCSFQQARAFVDDTPISIDNFESQMEALLAAGEAVHVKPPKLLPEFRAFRDEKLTTLKAPYYRYLYQRGFTHSQIIRLTERYDVFYAMRGAFSQRIIFVVREQGQIIGWTGRAISPRARVRYKALTNDARSASLHGLEPAAGRLPDFLLWYDTLRCVNGEALIISEGPIDALKTTVLGRRLGVFATCLFTSHASQRQLDLLHDIIPNFRRAIVLLDEGALDAGTRIASSLATLGVEAMPLPSGLKDPGELSSTKQLERLLLEGERNGRTKIRNSDGRQAGKVH